MSNGNILYIFWIVQSNRSIFCWRYSFKSSFRCLRTSKLLLGYGWLGLQGLFWLQELSGELESSLLLIATWFTWHFNQQGQFIVITPSQSHYKQILLLINSMHLDVASVGGEMSDRFLANPHGVNYMSCFACPTLLNDNHIEICIKDTSVHARWKE